MPPLTTTGSWLDKQDPCLVITVGNNVFKTERQQDAGTDAHFHEEFETLIDPSEYSSDIVKVRRRQTMPNFLPFLTQLHHTIK